MSLNSAAGEKPSSIDRLNKQAEWEFYRQQVNAWLISHRATMVFKFGTYREYLEDFFVQEAAKKSAKAMSIQAELDQIDLQMGVLKVKPEKPEENKTMIDMVAQEESAAKLAHLEIIKQVREVELRQAKAFSKNYLTDDEFALKQEFVYGALFKSVGPSYLHLVSEVKPGDVVGLWGALKSFFERTTDDNILNIQRRFFRLSAKDCDDSLPKFVAEINRLARMLDDMKAPVNDFNKLLILYDGLPSQELRTYSEVIRQAPTQPTFEQAVQKLLNKDATIKPHEQEGESTALYSNKSDRKSRQDGKRCEYCRMDNHTTDQCTSKKCINCGQKHRVADCSQKNIRPQDRPCFRCGLKGHVAKNCDEATDALFAISF